MKSVKKVFAVVVLLITLQTQLISCMTSQRKENNSDVIEYRKLEWTSLPVPDGSIFYDEEKNLVYMSPEYWLKLTAYIADIEKNIEILKSWK